MAKGKIFEDVNLRNLYFVFKDRSDAGKRLVKLMKDRIDIKNTYVLAIPSGGVPVAYEIAKAFNLPLELLIVRKIQIPGNTEAGFGSVGPDFEVIIDEGLVKRLKLTQQQIEKQIESTKKTLIHRNKILRDNREFPELLNKNVILVDDGVASGYTMKEAVKFVNKKGPELVIISIPTAPLDTINRLINDVDIIFCANIREQYPFAVADAYQEWYDLTDEEVLRYLKNN